MFKRKEKKANARERDFYVLMTGHSHKNLECVQALEKYIFTEQQEAYNEVIKAEDEADDIRRALVDEINRNFVTPIDREDLFAMSRAIDDIADFACSTAEAMKILTVPSNDNLKKMASILKDVTALIFKAVSHMKTRPVLAVEFAKQAKTLEKQMEIGYNEALVSLFGIQFTSLEDVKTTMKTREIYRHLLDAANRADQAADIITDILVKMS